MVELFLSEPEVDDTNLHVDAVRKRILLLQRVEEIIWSLLSSGGRYEARLWLCDTISKINSISPSNQRDLFIELLRSKRLNRDVAAQFVRMIFEKRPEEVGYVIAKRSNMLEKFFEGIFPCCPVCVFLSEFSLDMAHESTEVSDQSRILEAQEKHKNALLKSSF